MGPGEAWMGGTQFEDVSFVKEFIFIKVSFYTLKWTILPMFINEHPPFLIECGLG